MRVALITIVGGRLDHLERQTAGLSRSSLEPDARVIVAMDARELGAIGAVAPAADVVTLPGGHGRLPLARARNRGACRALAGGAELLVFLDVDCIPGERLLERYRAAATLAEDALLCGPVAYLEPPPAGGYDLDRLARGARGHPARPVPPEDEVWRGGAHSLFWSLSFAVRPATWLRLGGFCELYEGYGAEDTDFGQQAASTGVELAWVGGAWAYHQHHPVETPPVRHLDDILRNAERFRRRWGWWPMRDWLEGFARAGLVRYDTQSSRWVRRRRLAP